MKRLLILSLALLNASILLGQSTQWNSPAVLGEAPKGDDIFAFANFMAKRNPLNDLMFSEVRTRNIIIDPATVGSPYISEEFEPCSLYYKDELAEQLYYRYNGLNDEVELKESLTSEGMFSLNLDRNITLVSKDAILSLETLRTPKNGVRNSYVNRLYKGSTISLYERIKSKFSEGMRAQSSMVRSTPDKFSQFTQHYIQFEDQKLLEFIPAKKRKLINALPEKLQSKAISLFEENKYDLRTTSGLTAFISDLDN
ncbi:MAG: hypothetical protein O3B34_01405 [Bacteroidetes bacterium]|nr:hypothetical protein [Bacteroidota bacterium]